MSKQALTCGFFSNGESISACVFVGVMRNVRVALSQCSWKLIVCSCCMNL